MAHDPRKHGISEGRKQVFNRRAFFDRVGDGLYGVALAALLSGDLYGAPSTPEEAEGTPAIYDLTKRPPHFEPKAKSVIHLFMNGGPSQMDLFDP